jgi:NADH dehydrogenase
MRHQRITVFGGSGFLGRSLVKRLAGAGAVIRVAVRDPENAALLKPMGEVGQIVPVAASLRDEDSVRAAVAEADGVVNLVGILYESGKQTFEAIHHEGARRVAAAAHAAGAGRLVHVSAIGADMLSPAAYARTKASGEAAVRDNFPEATILRPSVLFGPDDDFFNRFAAMARLLPALPLFGGGTTRFQPVYVGDVAEAIMRSLQQPAARGKTYELGGPRTYSFKELMQIVLAEIRRRRVLLPLPFFVAELQAMFLELLPVPPLTRDQVKLLQRDNVASPDMPGLADLGIAPTAVEAIIPTYLRRFRAGGGFAPDQAA